MTTTYGFELMRDEQIPEFNTLARLWRHQKTGAELLSLENDDENKVFGITFRTPPADSTGVAHILEHAVLAGSRKYPLKEPFVELLKGSLQTFLNAFTFPDKTCYPVASQNVQDFHNLIDVYLDAVFYPRLLRHTFEQEGWHYELSNLDEPLVYKGVVFNEMKGANSSPDRVSNKWTQQSLFPETTYAVDSGGDPRHIPDLTYEQFKAFHESYYHPSNARIFFWGDDDPEERLRILDGYLSAFDQLAVESGVPLQPRFDEPRRLSRSYAAGDDNAGGAKSMVGVSWLLSEATDHEMALALAILAQILIGMPASPLRKALLDSGLGEDLAGVGLEEDLREMYFSTGLKGVAAENVDAVQAVILQTLERLANEGIDPETVHAALNTVEFQLRENNSGAYPRGLLLMLTALRSWLYERDSLGPLRFEAPLGAIKARVEAGEPYFEQLIRNCLLNNTHRTTLELHPDSTLGEREAEAERSRLQAARDTMSAAELQAIMENTVELRRLQETPDPPEALATIPSLQLEDLEKQNKIIPLAALEQGGTSVLYHDLFTNGILYLDVGLDLHRLPQELLPYVPLFGRALLETGAGKLDFVGLSQRIGRNTGGITPQLFSSTIKGTEASTAWLFLRAKAMPAQTEELFAILHDVLLSARLDNQERFRQIVLEEKAGQEARLVPAGHQVVNTRLRARFNEADWASEQMGGVSYLFFLRDLAQKVDEDWSAVLGALEELRRLLVNREGMFCNVTVDEANWERFRPQLDGFLDALPAAESAAARWSPVQMPRFEGLVIPAQVNYVGKGLDLYQQGFRLHGSEAAITKLLNTTWLWERIRVQGGAYGGFCQFDHRSGALSFLSYRDPNLERTLGIYDETSRFLRELDLSQSDLTRAIVGAIGAIDAYQLPDAKGFTSMQRYLVRDTDEERQRRRDELLATTVEDFHNFGEVIVRGIESAPVVVLGSQTAIEAANTAHPEWLTVARVL